MNRMISSNNKIICETQILTHDSFLVIIFGLKFTYDLAKIDYGIYILGPNDDYFKRYCNFI